MALLERLQRIGPATKTITVDAPEIGEGETVTLATRLSVEDAVEAGKIDFLGMPAFAQNIALFSFLAREKNGEPMAATVQEFNKLDGLALHAIVARSGIRDQVFAQLVDDSPEGNDGEGKSSQSS